MAVTIKDVAALAGVSPSTVSRTCKNNPSISEETKERVRKAMAELGYEPNFQASNLASQNSRTIGIILPASAKEVYENSFYLEAIQGISHYCNGRQYMTTIVTGQDETSSCFSRLHFFCICFVVLLFLFYTFRYHRFFIYFYFTAKKTTLQCICMKYCASARMRKHRESAQKQ